MNVESLDINMEKVNALVIDWGTNIIFFILGIIATFIIAKWIKSIVRKSLQKSQVDESLCRFLGKLTYFAIIALGIITCLSIFGVETASFAAVLAAAGLAIGMALQGTLGNFAAGVMILIFKPFQVGDFIEVAGESGTVAEIDIFNTMLNTPDNKRVIVPNGQVFGDTIENVSYHDTRRVAVAVGTDYEADIDKTREILMQAAKSTSDILEEPAPAIVLQELGDSSIGWSVRVWVKKENFWPVHDRLTRNVKYALDNAGIGIPYPQMDVHLDKANAPEA